LAEQVGNPTPDGMQRLLATYPWDAELVRDDWRTYVVQHWANPHAVLVFKETGALRPAKGPHTPLVPQEELIPLTVPEVRHLRWPLVWTEPSSLDHVLAWSRWRRRHQARARRWHDQRRLTKHSLKLRL
jgi:hypothetical protein